MDNSTIGKRLAEARKALGYSSQADFAQLLQIKQAALSKYETGYSSIPDEIKLFLIQNGISILWLLTGEGEMFLPTGKGEAPKPSLDALLATKEELEGKADRAELEQAQRSLERELQHTQERLQALRDIVYREHGIAEPEELDEPETTCRVLDVGLAAAAGPLRELDTIEDYIDVPESALPKNRKGIFVGRIEGASMQDIIPDGAKVLLRSCSEPRNGKVYVFTLRGQATIKKFHLDESGPHFEYMDGSGRSIYPEKSEKWYCNAEFLRVL